MNEELKNKIRGLPDSPGVYLFKDKRGKIIYIGKAKSLHSRVASYIHPADDPWSSKTKRMTAEAAGLDFILTGNELEALLLESTLVKKHRPHYNILLKDDSGYPYIKLTAEDFPRLEFARRIENDGAKYFGPYSSASGVRGTIRFLLRVFPLRFCREMKKKECLYYHIDKCPGPCAGGISSDEYSENVKAISMFLEGRTDKALHKMRKEMEAAAAAKNFEKAAMLRDRIGALEKVTKEKQTVMFKDGADRDVIAIAREESSACAEVMFVREGKLSGHDPLMLSVQPEQTPEEILSAFLKLFYSAANTVPHEIIIEGEIDERELLEEFLRARAERAVRIITPKRGAKKELAATAAKNALRRLQEEIAKERLDREEKRKLTQAISSRIGGAGLIRRIVGFDISTIQGTNTVGSAVTFIDAAPYKDGYRKFIIRGGGRDDFSSMKEMTGRYFARVKDGVEPCPDLVIIDGGKGQVSAAVEGISEEFPSCGARVIGYAKKTGVSHVAGESTPIIFSEDETATRLVRMVIAEAHRFAITFHRKKRGKGMIE